MEIEDTAYIPREDRQVDLRMYIKKYSNVITVEFRDIDDDREEIIYFSVSTEEVKKMIEKGGFA